MTRPVVKLAAEGKPDLAILRRLVRDVGLEPGPEYGKRGKAHLDQNLARYNLAARDVPEPWVVARDLDHDESCPAALVRRLVANPAHLMRCRVVVRASEAWLLGDRERFRAEFQLSMSAIPRMPEALTNPKQIVLHALAASRSREIRETMVRSGSAGAVEIGPQYNARLEAFAEGNWRPDVAATTAPSLDRARRRLWELADVLNRHRSD